MKNLNILILERFFLGLASMREARQSISCNIGFSLIIIDLKVVSSELLSPTNLARASAFCIYKLTEVIMVSIDKDFVFIDFYVAASSFEDLNNGQKLLIMSFVMCFYWNHLPREKNHWVLLANFELWEIRMIFVGYVIGRKFNRSHLT